MSCGALARAFSVSDTSSSMMAATGCTFVRCVRDIPAGRKPFSISPWMAAFGTEPAAKAASSAAEAPPYSFYR